MSGTEQFFRTTFGIFLLIALFALFFAIFYFLLKLHKSRLKSSLDSGKISNPLLVKKYNDVKSQLDNKIKIFITSFAAGLLLGVLVIGIFKGIVIGFLYYFLSRKTLSNSLELYKQAMIERNLPL